MVWIMSGKEIEIEVEAESMDEAFEKARKINSSINSAQVKRGE